MVFAKHFGGLTAVNDVSLDVHVGEIHAVIGPNGAGKSTLINLLSGDLIANTGTITLGTTDITRLAPDRRARSGLGRSYQKTTIFPDFTVYENVRLAAQAHAKQPLRMIGAGAVGCHDRQPRLRRAGENRSGVARSRHGAASQPWRATPA